MTNKNNDNRGQQQPLLSSISVALSLSPPRVPPHGSVLRKLYTHPKHAHRHLQGVGVGLGHRRGDTNYDDDSNDDYSYQSHTLTSRLLQLFATHHERHFQNHHPHLPTSLSVPDYLTRFLGVALPLETQHSMRDGGTFRSIADNMVKLTCPLVGLGHMREVREFLELTDHYFSPSDASSAVGSDAITNDGAADQNEVENPDSGRQKVQTQRQKKRWMKKRIPYGDHQMQYIDLFVPLEHLQNKHESSNASTDKRIPVRGTLFFVHGGAWGAGHPWMYRLVAPTFLKLGFAVVIVGYRTYPDAPTIDDQCGDVKMAWDKSEVVLNRLVVPTMRSHNDKDGWVGNILMGHSSGAHVSLLMLVDWIEERMSGAGLAKDNVQMRYKLTPDYYVGLSGPYDISYHFDFEGGRGVEQISPMKPICGHSRDNFDKASPVKRLLSLLGKQSEDSILDSNASPTTIQQLIPPILLVHGIEDDTVPFTATSDAGRLLRSCGLNNCDEIYLEETGHQEVIMHFMLGGLAKELVLNWLFQCNKSMEERSVSQLQSRL